MTYICSCSGGKDSVATIILAHEKDYPLDELPPEGVLVETKIDDGGGGRNHTLLTRKGNLYYSDNGTYTYYAPTHWRFYDGGDLKDE